ncbi:MAG TPA: tetratricopeptide repeat protein [Blastocatellia bacterium]|nr:tetratricopeptide repeat protein [Blastocatellia bacterium]
MILELSLERKTARASFVMLALIAGVALGSLVFVHFVTGMLTDRRVRVDKRALGIAVGYFPGSARLHAQMAEVEMTDRARNLLLARSHALEAMRLSPWDFRFRMLVASVTEAMGDRASAEASLREALALAPRNGDLHWRLANLLLRSGKLDDAIPEFRVAAGSDASLVPVTLDLVARASGGNLSALGAITGGEPERELALARYLLKESRTAEAAEVFAKVGRDAKVASRARSEFINELIARGEVRLARKLWLDYSSGEASTEGGTLVWNGGFESDAASDLSQFDWAIRKTDYARIGMDSSDARTGKRSLRVSFTGKDTTRLDKEIGQTIVVRAGAAYRLECYAKARDLVTPEGPVVAVTGGKARGWIAASEPVGAESSGWQRLTFDFIAPPDSDSVVLSIKRKPRFSYDDPTLGTVWFDDFSIKEIPNGLAHPVGSEHQAGGLRAGGAK